MKKLYHILFNKELVGTAELPTDRRASNLIAIIPSGNSQRIRLYTGLLPSDSSLSDIDMIKNTLEQNGIRTTDLEIVEAS